MKHLFCILACLLLTGCISETITEIEEPEPVSVLAGVWHGAGQGVDGFQRAHELTFTLEQADSHLWGQGTWTQTLEGGRTLSSAIWITGQYFDPDQVGLTVGTSWGPASMLGTMTESAGLLTWGSSYQIRLSRQQAL